MERDAAKNKTKNGSLLEATVRKRRRAGVGNEKKFGGWVNECGLSGGGASKYSMARTRPGKCNQSVLWLVTPAGLSVSVRKDRSTNSSVVRSLVSSNIKDLHGMLATNAPDNDKRRPAFLDMAVMAAGLA